jgi:glucose-6-phosphate isomerase
LVDLRKVDLNGAQIMTLYYHRGYNVQEILEGARAMAKCAAIQDIDNVSARLHAALKR